MSHACGVSDLQTDAEAVEREFSCYVRHTEPEAIQAPYKDPDGESIQPHAVQHVLIRCRVRRPYCELKSSAARKSRMAGAFASRPNFNDNTRLTHTAIVDVFVDISGFHTNSTL